MACKTENKVIGDHEFSVTQWPADKALLMKFKLTKIFGPALANLSQAIGEKGKKADPDKESEAISKTVSSLFERTEPEEMVSLMKSCVVGVACDGTRITESTFNELFSGDDLMEVYKVFIFVMKVNFGNLFKGQLVESLLARVKENL